MNQNRASSRAQQPRTLVGLVLCVLGGGVLLAIILASIALAQSHSATKHAQSPPPSLPGGGTVAVHALPDVYCCNPNLIDRACESVDNVATPLSQQCKVDDGYVHIDVEPSEGPGLYTLRGLVSDNGNCTQLRQLRMYITNGNTEELIDVYNVDNIEEVQDRTHLPEAVDTLAYEHTVWLDASWRARYFPIGFGDDEYLPCFMTLRNNTVFKLASVQ